MIVKKYGYFYGIEVLAFLYTTISTMSLVGGIVIEAKSTEFKNDYADEESIATTEDTIIHQDWIVVEQEGGVFQQGRSVESNNELEMQNPYPPSFGICTASSHCLGHNVECNLRISRCVCRQNFADNGTGICSECPYEGDPCINCCSDIGVACINGVCRRCFTEDGRSLCNSDAILIVTISQIALSTALIMGIAALLVLWYRMCTRTNYFASNYIRSDPEHICERSFPHASLTSVQIRIMARLRDRPPTYESNDAYDSRVQREQGQHVQRVSFAGQPQLNTDIHIIAGRGHAPPCYEAGILSMNEQPPPYPDDSGSSQMTNPSPTLTNPTANDQRIEHIKPITRICIINDNEKTVHM